MNISTYEVMDGLVRMFETINPDMPKETKSVIRKAVNDKKKDVENVEVDTLSNLQQTFFIYKSSSSLDDSLLLIAPYGIETSVAVRIDAHDVAPFNCTLWD